MRIFPATNETSCDSDSGNTRRSSHRTQPSRLPTRVGSYRYVKRRWKLLFRCFDQVTSLFPSSFWRITTRRKERWPPRRILLIQLDHIGDSVLSTGLPRVLQQQFPEATVDVLCSRWNRPLFQLLPEVNQVLVSARNWHARTADAHSIVGEVLRLSQTLAAQQYDVAVDIRGDFPTVVTMWLAGIPTRIGWDCAGGKQLLTHVVPWDPAVHELEHRLRIIQVVAPNVALQDIIPRIPLRSTDRTTIRARLRKEDNQGPIAVVHISAGTKSKRWPTHYYHELITELHDWLGAVCILVGAKEDRPIAERLARLGTPALDWAGTLTLPQLAALAAEADVFVGPDSGPAHLAAAVGTPTVVLFSGTNRNSQWLPFGPQVIPLAYPTPCSPCASKTCPVPGHPCMAGITPDLVARIVARMVTDRQVQAARDLPAMERRTATAATA